MKQTTLSACIRSLRMQNHMTQAQLADILGVTDKAVSKWERGLSYPDISLIPKLADVLGTTVDGLLRDCEEECRPASLLQVFEMSKDIRLPLHVILGCTEIIRNNHEDPEMLEKYLDGIKVSGEYLMILLDRILNDRKGRSGQEEAGQADLPAAEITLEYLQERNASRQMQIRKFQFKGCRILVAEDMAINREIAAEILKQTGAVIEFAEDGQICLDKVTSAPEGHYDLILMDIMMPNMDGLEATRRIRSLPGKARAEIPIIAMTTNVSEKDRQQALDAGMDAFEEKPILTERLFETIEQLLRRGE